MENWDSILTRLQDENSYHLYACNKPKGSEQLLTEKLINQHDELSYRLQKYSDTQNKYSYWQVKYSYQQEEWNNQKNEYSYWQGKYSLGTHLVTNRTGRLQTG